MLRTFTSQTEEQKKRLKDFYSPDKLFVVEHFYEADEKLAQLSQKVGDLVGVIRHYDPSNQKHIWFVDNGS